MNAWKHFITISKHRRLVFRHCRKAGLFWQGLVHDLSKFSWAEFSVGVKYYQENRSPNEKERREIGYSTAWLHHQGRNKHHFEYWLDYNPVKKMLSPIEMPPRYLVEMVCDRMAASKVYEGSNYTNASPLEYLLRSKDRIMMHEQTKEDLERLLTLLKDEGEEALFEQLRLLVKSEKKRHIQ